MMSVSTEARVTSCLMERQRQEIVAWVASLLAVVDIWAWRLSTAVLRQEMLAVVE